MLNLAARRASRTARGALAVECEQNNRSGDENNTLADPESACI